MGGPLNGGLLLDIFRNDVLGVGYVNRRLDSSFDDFVNFVNPSELQ